MLVDLYPWIKKVESILTKDMILYQFGVDETTFWIAERVRDVYAVESNPSKFQMIANHMHNERITNIEVVARKKDHWIYLEHILSFHDEYFDGVIMDTLHVKAVEKVKKNGFIVVTQKNEMFKRAP